MNSSQIRLESKLVFGSKELLLNDERLRVFPVERPLDGSILVFDSSGTFMGRGVGSHCNKTGSCITIDGEKFDSNHYLLWQYQ